MACAPATDVTPSPELLAISKHSSDLCQGITITSFALSLVQGGLIIITSDAKSSVLSTAGIGDLDKCASLLDAVREQVRIDRKKFEPFLGIFRREPALSYYADMMTTTCEIEAKKRSLIPASCGSSSPLSVQSHGTIHLDLSSVEYGVLMRDLVRILEDSNDSLKNMKIAFVHMVHHTECRAYEGIIQSEQYRAVDTVETFFELLAPYLKAPDCSLLRALVTAANCQRAMQRLMEYLDKSHSFVVLAVENSCVSLPENAPESESDANDAAASNPVINYEPVANSSAVPVIAQVARDEMSYGVLRYTQSLLCGLFGVPQFALQYNKAEPGSVKIKWTTSPKIAMHMKSVVLDDGDLKLLLQEKIVSVQVGLDYKIFAGNREYWKVDKLKKMLVRLEKGWKEWNQRWEELNQRQQQGKMTDLLMDPVEEVLELWSKLHAEEMKLQEVKWLSVEEKRLLGDDSKVGMIHEDMILQMEKEMEVAKESVRHSVIELAKDVKKEMNELADIVDEQILLAEERRRHAEEQIKHHRKRAEEQIQHAKDQRQITQYQIKQAKKHAEDRMMHAEKQTLIAEEKRMHAEKQTLFAEKRRMLAEEQIMLAEEQALQAEMEIKRIEQLIKHVEGAIQVVADQMDRLKERTKHSDTESEPITSSNEEILVEMQELNGRIKYLMEMKLSYQKACLEKGTELKKDMLLWKMTLLDMGGFIGAALRNALEKYEKSVERQAEMQTHEKTPEKHVQSDEDKRPQEKMEMKGSVVHKEPLETDSETDSDDGSKKGLGTHEQPLETHFKLDETEKLQARRKKLFSKVRSSPSHKVWMKGSDSTTQYHTQPSHRHDDSIEQELGALWREKMMHARAKPPPLPATPSQMWMAGLGARGPAQFHKKPRVRLPRVKMGQRATSSQLPTEHEKLLQGQVLPQHMRMEERATSSQLPTEHKEPLQGQVLGDTGLPGHVTMERIRRSKSF